MFIKLTRCDIRPTKTVYINVDNVTLFDRNEHHTYLALTSGKGVWVKESPEQIHQLLTESYITVKESQFKEES